MFARSKKRNGVPIEVWVERSQDGSLTDEEWESELTPAEYVSWKRFLKEEARAEYMAWCDEHSEAIRAEVERQTGRKIKVIRRGSSYDDSQELWGGALTPVEVNAAVSELWRKKGGTYLPGMDH
jgi:hypothetical protein